MKPKHKNQLLLGCFSALWTVSLAQGENYNDSLSPITYIPIVEGSASTTVVAGSAAVKRSFLEELLDYLSDASKEEKNKRFDFSVIGGPYYSSNTKLELELVAAGLYRTDRTDTLLSLSAVSLYSDVSTVGFYLLDIRGNHIFPRDKYRLNYNLCFYSFPSLYWGIGYQNAVSDENESSYERFQTQVRVDFMFRLAKNFYLGPMAGLDYIDGRNFEKPELWQGMDTRTTSVSAGLSLVYDSRNFPMSVYKGCYLRIDQRFSPALLGSDYAFNSTGLTTSYCRRIWKGRMLAGQLHTLLTCDNPPWGSVATLGSSYPMHGYYGGRFRDKNVVDMQAEPQQHIWKCSGVAVWMGVGDIFPDFSSFEVRHMLPNYGLGYRREFKKRVNVRLDLGFGKGQTGFILNINETFQ